MQNITESLPLAGHCTMRVGGIARRGCCPDTEEDLCKAISECRMESSRYAVIGNASNCIFPDTGYDGTVIFTTEIRGIRIDGTLLTASCGEKLSAVARAARDASLSGLEFAYGIPGTVGGAVYMNAGAYGGEIKDCLSTVKVLDGNGEISVLPVQELELSYRRSIFMKRELIILEASFELTRGDKDTISALMEDYTRRRSEKQPLDKPSCGSTFKRPEGNFAGALIEQCGLKGMRIGGASVSEKHAGFIRSGGGATSCDIPAVIKAVQKKVFEERGVRLEPGIRIFE